MRDLILSNIFDLLQRRGFDVNSFAHTSSCFDLVARKGVLILIIKVYSNIDSMRQEQGTELKRMAGALGATPFVVGNKTKAFSLSSGKIYERYGISAMNLQSFRELLDEKLPSIKNFKGRDIVDLDSEKLREARKRQGMSIEELARKIDSTPESIHRYEKGYSASLGAAHKLERALKTHLVKEINLFDWKPGDDTFEERLDDETLEKIRSLGLKLAVFEHAPFRAFSLPEEKLLIHKGEGRAELRRKAIGLKMSEPIFDSDSMIVSKETKYKKIEDVPVIGEEELDSMSRYRDLLKLLKERKEHG
ncbi:MAG: helix-turn-helix domain-containing protein [Candidatus Diapherotrites archaeon]